MRFLTWLAGFLEQGTAQSSTRVAGLVLAFATAAFPFFHPGEAATTAAMGVTATGFFFSRKNGPTIPES